MMPPRRSRDDGTAAHPGRDGPGSKKLSDRGRGRRAGARHGRSFGIGIRGGDRSQTDQCQTKTGAEPVTYPKQCTHHRLVASHVRDPNVRLGPSLNDLIRSGINRSRVSRTWVRQGDANRMGVAKTACHRRGCAPIAGESPIPPKRGTDQNCAKKSFPLSSTMMNAGKFSTSIRQMASMPSSSYSSISTFLMQFFARMAAGPPIEPR